MTTTHQDANEREELAKKLLDDLFAVPYHPKGLIDVCGLHEKHVSQCYGCRHAKWSYIIKSELRDRLDVLNVWHELNDYILADRKSQKAALLEEFLNIIGKDEARPSEGPKRNGVDQALRRTRNNLKANLRQKVLKEQAKQQDGQKND